MSLLVNPSYGKTFEVSGAKQLEKISGNEDLIVGKKKEINMDKTKNELTFDKTYYEKFQQSRASESDDYTSLKTQSWINISPGTIEYSVELPSDSHKKSSFNFNRGMVRTAITMPLMLIKAYNQFTATKHLMRIRIMLFPFSGKS